MTKEDKADLDTLLRDITVELRDLRNSRSAHQYLPMLVAKARELELLMKGGIAEVRETVVKEEQEV